MISAAELRNSERELQQLLFQTAFSSAHLVIASISELWGNLCLVLLAEIGGQGVDGGVLKQVEHREVDRRFPAEDPAGLYRHGAGHGRPCRRRGAVVDPASVREAHQSTRRVAKG